MRDLVVESQTRFPRGKIMTICQGCEVFFKPKYDKGGYKQRYHNYSCFVKNGKHKSWFKKNHRTNVGIKRSEREKLNLRIQRLGKNNPNWKGTEVGYDGLHQWIKRHKPVEKLCERCNKNKPYDLANISGKYKRDISDFEWLCRRCHMQKDGRINNLKRYKRK